MYRETYDKKETTKLCDRLKSELSGTHEELIIRLLLRGRANNPRDDAAAVNQAATVFQIIKDGSGITGFKSDAERKLIEVFCDNSPIQLKAIAVRYLH